MRGNKMQPTNTDNNNQQNLEGALSNLQAFNKLTSDRAQVEEWFWQWVDHYILKAIEAGDCPVVWEREHEWGVAGTAIYNYQVQLLKEIEKIDKIPFPYSASQVGLNRSFNRRQGLTPQTLWVGQGKPTAKGVIIPKREKIKK
jgi:hypothetical protein